MNITFRPLYPANKERRYPLNRRLGESQREKNRKSLAFADGRTPDSPDCSPVAVTTTLSRLPHHHRVRYRNPRRICFQSSCFPLIRPFTLFISVIRHDCPHYGHYRIYTEICCYLENTFYCVAVFTEAVVANRVSG